MAADALQRFLEQVSRADPEAREPPPVERWNPELSGDIDIRIDRSGRWFHEGEEIRRPALVKLFASILKAEGDEFFLVTPVEKWRIRVDDAPFLVVDVEHTRFENMPVLLFRTSTGDIVPLGAEHPLRVEIDPDSGEPSPYLAVRHGMQGRVNRATYYRLVDMAIPALIDGSDCYVVESLGCQFRLA